MTKPFLRKTTSNGKALPGQAKQFLLEAVTSPADKCIPWPYGKDRLGYGRVSWGGKQRPAHRAAWEIYYGQEMPRHLDACHAPLVCHDRACINPLHIRPGTRAENMADAILDGTGARGGNNKLAKLNEQSVLAIRADTRTHRQIAEAYGVSFDTVRSIKIRRRWGWLSDPELIT